MMEDDGIMKSMKGLNKANTRRTSGPPLIRTVHDSQDDHLQVLPFGQSRLRLDLNENIYRNLKFKIVLFQFQLST